MMQITKALPAKKVKETFILIDAKQGKCHKLEGVAPLIWRLLDETNSVEEIVQKLSQKYPDEDRSQIKKDVQGFVDQALRLEIVKQINSKQP
jgi:hypothetical protein